jgi:hypothetical protein
VNAGRHHRPEDLPRDPHVVAPVIRSVKEARVPVPLATEHEPSRLIATALMRELLS